MIDTLSAMLDWLAAGLVAVLMVPLAMTFWRLVRGPGYADRFIAVDMLTGIAVAMAALVAGTTGRREFLDVAFGIALISFVGTCAFAAFLERKGGRR
ncbi:monovalent cation/H+ antiporter complex subunit F [Aureimonas sp. SK2]|uniref:monovalent cation/H+ antiporter complex subunit F n=1 Tax=Aureimonas sp. SK2 TaxID=3015992 RepID=UPI0024439025|nr:monovalent cation/H+ antiporter complex subunit F [Aureimonas sp. SK2]